MHEEDNLYTILFYIAYHICDAKVKKTMVYTIFQFKVKCVCVCIYLVCRVIWETSQPKHLRLGWGVLGKARFGRHCFQICSSSQWQRVDSAMVVANANRQTLSAPTRRQTRKRGKRERERMLTLQNYFFSYDNLCINMFVGSTFDTKEGKNLRFYWKMVTNNPKYFSFLQLATTVFFNLGKY